MRSPASAPGSYRGRLAPSPTGFLHLGHARTFQVASDRCRAAKGTLLLRLDDLDFSRCRPEYSEAIFEDLAWLGWSEFSSGADVLRQSTRLEIYADAFERLRANGHLFPCRCSRQDVQRALGAPHAGEDETLYPGTCRERPSDVPRAGINWRFRVPRGESISFLDGSFGAQTSIAGKDFGDFLVWRKDDLPSYQLACAVDDALLAVTEVVRGADLITSTFRQLLLLRALDFSPPRYFHAPLLLDAHGQRLAKRSDALSLRGLRAQGWTAETLRNADFRVGVGEKIRG